MEYATVAQATRTNWRNVITVMSIMILVGAEVFGVAISAGWALAGWLELGDIVGYVLMGLFSLFAVYILVHLWRRCVAVEPLTSRA
jgi:predicted membrane channel-forming protein YqfA (hemolysin III family)